MIYCKTCLQPDTRPGTRFDENGICPACNYFESLKEVDWDERMNEIWPIVEFGKKNNRSGYDCIIGVSGGKDSTRQAIFVKEILKMKPLLVCLSYPPEQVTQRGVDNISNLIDLGFDTITMNLAPKTWQALMRKAFLQFANWCKSTEMALFASVPRLAIAYQIPLIWWGENAALQLGDLGVLGKNGWDGNNLKHMNTLAGGNLQWMLGNGIESKHILQYHYPSDREMDNANLQIVFLGYFWKDWSLVENANYAMLRGLEIRNEPPEILGDTYGVTSLDEDWVGMNQMIKYLKFGFGRMADYVNEDVRRNRITREQGIELLKKYDGKVGDEYIESFCRYIDIPVKQFWEIVDSNVNKKLFYKDTDGRWKPKFEIGVGLKESVASY
ncbi:MAG TPA: N-acetyl sugar amidotransferase [Bacteroidia bacterium]|nr:N-acetyl sugar amidotransferase [Bacteroidia bacterium]